MGYLPTLPIITPSSEGSGTGISRARSLPSGLPLHPTGPGLQAGGSHRARCHRNAAPTARAVPGSCTAGRCGWAPCRTTGRGCGRKGKRLMKPAAGRAPAEREGRAAGSAPRPEEEAAPPAHPPLTRPDGRCARTARQPRRARCRRSQSKWCSARGSAWRDRQR